MPIWLTGQRTATIAALVEAELRARGQSVELLESLPRTRRFRSEHLVEVHVGDPTGKPELVIDTDRESAVDAAEHVLAFIDGQALA